jgi:hypothetical protein
MSKTEDTFARIKELEQEVKALRIVYRKARTYYNAVRLQNRSKERNALILALRSRIRLVADNSDLLEELG